MLCVGDEYRKCFDVEIIKLVVEKIKKYDFVKILSRKIIEFEKELIVFKGKYEKNLIEIESKFDSIKEVNRFCKEINDYLDKIENEYMNELGEVIKMSREILNKCIDFVLDRIYFSRYCI